MKLDREKHLSELKQKLDDIELEQKNGAKFYSVDELDAALKKIVDNNKDNSTLK